MDKSQGLTVIELLITLFILSLLTAIALPDFEEMLQQKRIDLTAKELRQAIEVARTAAITKNSIVTICRSKQGNSCSGQWQDGVLVFVDYNADRKLDVEDIPVRHFTFSQFKGDITWRAFQNRQYLQITALGFTNYQNGNFTLCPANGDLTQARQLIITRTARVRHAQDSNGDGIREDSRGRPVRCG